MTAMPAPDLTLCVDAGTSLVKSVVFDQSGAVVAQASRPSPVRTPLPGHSEQDMNDVRLAVELTMTEAATEIAERIDLIAITAQGDGYWPITAEGEPAGPAILWNDARAAAIVDEWEDGGVLDAAFRIGGSYGNRGLPHAVLRDRLAHDGADGVAQILTCGAWLHHALTGVTGLEPSDASAPWLDITTGAVSDDLVALYGLTRQRSLVPDVLDARTSIAPLLPHVAARLGLRDDVRVAITPYDVVSTAFGTGALSEGDAFCILGTTLCVGVVRDEPDLAGPARGLTIRTALDDRVVRAFPTLTGTGVLEWAASLLGVDGAPALTALARDSVFGAHGVRLLPYLSPAGERNPFLDGDARGVIFNLSAQHGPADVARATLEALACVIRECVEAAGVQARSLTIAGGGAASDVWLQTIADVVGVDVVRAADAQAGAKGAQMVARVLAGDRESLADAASAYVSDGERIRPDTRHRDAADRLYADFLRTRSVIEKVWSQWPGATEGRS